MYFRNFLGKACANDATIAGFGPAGTIICKFGAAGSLTGAISGPDNFIPMWTNNGKSFTSSPLSKDGANLNANNSNLMVDGNVTVGKDVPGWAHSPSSGARLLFAGTPGNSDLLMMYRYNQSRDASDLRLVLGDNPIDSATVDRLQIGIAHDGTTSAGDDKNTNLFNPTFTFLSNGKLGILTQTPKAQLDVNGNIRLGMDPTIACAGDSSGQMRFNAGNRKVEFCDGTSWKTFDMTPTGAIMAFYRNACPE